MKNRKDILINQKKMYALTEDELGNYYLEVMVGSIAMENLVVPLSIDEKKMYLQQGVEFLDEKSFKVCKHSQLFRL